MYQRIYSFESNTYFIEYPITSLNGLEVKIVTTKPLNYEAGISESKYNFD